MTHALFWNWGGVGGVRGVPYFLTPISTLTHSLSLLRIPASALAQVPGRTDPTDILLVFEEISQIPVHHAFRMVYHLLSGLMASYAL